MIENKSSSENSESSKSSMDRVVNQYEMTLQDKIYRKLLDLEGEYLIEEKVSEENRPAFIEIVKEYIRYDFGRAFGFYIEFSNDYKKIRKVKYI